MSKSSYSSKYAHIKKTKLCLTIQRNPIEQVTETKLLGITLDEKMSWSSHTDKITITHYLKCQEQYLQLNIHVYLSRLKQVAQCLVLTHLHCLPLCSKKKRLAEASDGRGWIKLASVLVHSSLSPV